MDQVLHAVHAMPGHCFQQHSKLLFVAVVSVAVFIAVAVAAATTTTTTTTTKIAAAQ